MKKEVTNYDTYDYDYSTYWQNRSYENIAEHMVLERMFTEKGAWFLDIGGSYGRLTDTYSSKYTNCIILDYSLKTLIKNRDSIRKSFPNTEMIAANAYKMPFREDLFDGGLMVRVLHHIERPEEYLRELKRVLRDNSVYIQEFANKVHIKAKIKAILKLDLKFFTKEPYQQPTINLEGAKNPGVTFLNYHPKYLRELFAKNGFSMLEKQGCSYLRSPILKRKLGEQTLVKIEGVLQKILKTTNIPPSIFFKTRVKKNSKSESHISLEEVLICPECKGDLELKKDEAKCRECKKQYFKKDNVWDFRVE